MATFPGDPFLHLLYANFLLEVAHNAPASRTQLQLVGGRGSVWVVGGTRGASVAWLLCDLQACGTAR